ncbi:MAG: HD-GYP domain-containing protein [Bermanella sp.]
MNKNVAIDDLEVGMYISDVGNEWIPAKRKKRKGYIRSQATIDKIKSLGVLHVCIEFPSGSAVSSGAVVEKVACESASDSIDPDASALQSMADNIKNNEQIVMMDSKFAKNAEVRSVAKKTNGKDKPEKIVMNETAHTAKEKEKEKENSKIQKMAKKEADNHELEGDAGNNGEPDKDLAQTPENETQASSGGGLLAQIKAEKDSSSTSLKKSSVKAMDPLVGKEGIAQKAKKYIPGAVVVPFSEEIINAKSVHCDAKQKVEEAMTLAKMGKPFDIDGIENLADSLIDSIISNRNTLAMMTVIKSRDNYLYEHSVNCGVLMGIFARHLKLAFDVIHDLVVGAILHDIGMTEISSDIIDKPSELTAAERTEMQRHVVLGRKMLEKNRGVPAIALEVCKQHHERLDGQGYMLKIHSHQINQYGRVGAIVDVYDALTTERSYRKAFAPGAAMKKLLEMGGGDLDAKLVYQFIQCINIFPVGSLVQLDDSRVGVVHELNVFKKDKPKVRVFYSGKDDAYFEAETVDLADPNVRIKIKKTVDINDFDIGLEDVI